MKALYRKYRSKTLEEVVGQEHITVTLQRALAAGSLNHAYLFTGPRGVGKTSVARILAHQLNELSYTDESLHLDIVEIDAASNRRIDDIRDLREKVHVSPVNAKYKVYIIDEVHMLTGESFNALLKTLEEPPAHVIFILATTEVHKLPATIISRTQRYHFRPVNKNKVMGHLKHIAKNENITIDEPALELIAEYGEGSFRDSISLLDQLASMSGKKIDSTLVEQTLGLAGRQDIERITEMLKKGMAKELHVLLMKLEAKGVSAPILGQQLIRELRSVPTGQAAVYALIDKLLDAIKSPHGWIKLFVVLLQYAGSKEANKSTEPDMVKKTARPQAKAALSTADEAVLAVSRMPAEIKRSTKLLEAESAATVQMNHGNTGQSLDIEGWNRALIELQRTNPPLYSIVKKSEPRFGEHRLEIAVRFKLHKVKLEDTRYRMKLMECLDGLGFDCPELKITIDPSATAPVLSVTKAESIADETTSSVLAMMGGGEVVNGQSEVR